MPNLIKILADIEIEPILESYIKNEPSFVWLADQHKGKQTGLQFYDNSDPWLSATGRTNISAMKFDKINPFFIGTIFEEIINLYNLKRTRLLWLNSWSCYTFHTDDSPRIHIPLITNPNSYMLFKNGLINHLEIGKVYWVDTRKEHSAMNGSNNPRLHIVGCVSG